MYGAARPIVLRLCGASLAWACLHYLGATPAAAVDALLLLPLASRSLLLVLCPWIVAATLWPLLVFSTIPTWLWGTVLAALVLSLSLRRRLVVFQTAPQPLHPLWQSLRSVWVWGVGAWALYLAVSAMFRPTEPVDVLARAITFATLWWALRAAARAKGKADKAGLLLGITSIAGCAIFLEVTVRLLLPMPPIAPELYQADKESLYTLRPGIETTLHLRAPDKAEAPEIPVHTNSLGFRGEEVPLQKQPGEVRVLCLGDSYTFGWGVIEEHAYPAHLQAALQAGLPGRTVRVINAGTGGYGPWQARILLNRHGWNLQPDLVVLQTFVANDIADTLLRDDILLESYEPNWVDFISACREANTLGYKCNRWLREVSSLYLFLEVNLLGPWALLDACRNFRLSPLQPRFSRPQSLGHEWAAEPDLLEWSPSLELGWDRYKQDITAIASDCRTKGLPLLAFNIPWPAAASRFDSRVPPKRRALYGRDKASQLCEAFLETVADERLPALELFRSQPEPEGIIFPDDGHLTNTGNAYLAEALARLALPMLPGQP